MKKSKYLSLTSIILILWITSGCSPIATSTESSATETVFTGEESYPSFISGEPGAADYPAPDVIPTRLPVGVLPDIPTSVEQPEPGMASVTGVLFSYTQSRVLPITLFYLTPGFGPDNIVPLIIDEPNSEKGDIEGFSDENGFISLNNVPPGIYYLIVMAPYSWSIGEVSGEDQTPLKIELKEGDQLNLGVIYLSWP